MDDGECKWDGRKPPQSKRNFKDHKVKNPSIPTDTTTDNEPNNDGIVNFLKTSASITQDIATGIDLFWATIDVGIGVIGLGEGPETIPVVVMGMDIAFNVSGGNAAETAFSGLSLVLTFFADVIDDGELGEDTLTSATTFGAGLAMPDPIGDLVIDGYASGYNHGIFNGIDTIMNGGPIFKFEWKWY